MSLARLPRRNYFTDPTGTCETHSEEQDSFCSARKKTAAGRAHKYFIKYQSGNDSQRTDYTGHKWILRKDAQPASVRASLEDDYIGWAVYMEEDCRIRVRDLQSGLLTEFRNENPNSHWILNSEHKRELVRNLQHGQLLEIRKVDAYYKWLLYTENNMEVLINVPPGNLTQIQGENCSNRTDYTEHERELAEPPTINNCQLIDDTDEMLKKLRDLEPGNYCHPADYTEHNRKLLSELQPGDLIEIPRGLYSHWAVYVGNESVVHVTGLDGDNIRSALRHMSSVSGYGYPKAEVRVDRFYDAVRGSEALRNNILDGQMTPLPREEIVRNACSRIGLTAYNVLYQNCEHFATWCRYGISTSQQAQDFLQALGITTSVVALGGFVVALVSFFRFLAFCFQIPRRNN